MRILRGVPVSSGVALGRAYVLLAPTSLAPRRALTEGEVASDLDRFDSALAQAEGDLRVLQESVTQQLGGKEAEIFGAQALLLRSSRLAEPVRTRVREGRINVESALSDVLEELVRAFEVVPDTYLKERGADLRDVGQRLLSLLLARSSGAASSLPEDAIVVATELVPSVTAQLEIQQVEALVTETGGKSSHASILARSQGVAAIVGVEGATREIKSGDRLIVDGIAGVVIIDPDAKVERDYRRIEASLSSRHQELSGLRHLPSVTSCGTPIPLLANVGKLADAEVAVRHGAEGIGLYRTEFGFAVRSRFPTVDEQVEFLSKSAARFPDQRAVLRLLDIGGDKDLPYFPLPTSPNPSLGQRGIRLLLKHGDLLRGQLEAFLRVSAAHAVGILLPMVGGLEEVRETKRIMASVQQEMGSRGQAFDPAVPIGAMIEVPSAALMARRLAREVDFFCLGTNDLVQYVLAADREDSSVAQYYQPLHPAILRLIRDLVVTLADTGKPLTLCGEMAGNPASTALLLGLGVRRFSVGPGQLLEVKDAIRRTDLAQAERLGLKALELESVAEIEALVGAQATPAPQVPGAPLSGVA